MKPTEPLTPKEFAPFVRRSVRWVQRGCQTGKIRTLAIGKPYTIPPEEIERLTTTTDGNTDSDCNR